MVGKRQALRPSVRRAAIHEIIEKTGGASVDALAERFDASTETVRRDLNALAKAGRVRKVHGGAVKASITPEGLFEERLAVNAQAKQEIAEKLSKLVEPGQSIMMDTGSTTLVCAGALAHVRDLTVITNSVRIAQTIASVNNGSRVILLGGTYRTDNSQTVGAHTCSEISRIRTDHVVLTVTGFDGSGAYDFSESEAQIARAMAENTGALTVVADSSKFGRNSTFKVCNLERIDRLVLESNPLPDAKAALIAAGIAVI
ncbi:DeoR/GlpR family DNA-binding transcription regulator [Primorskyibacter marinus]|uniref:DeoR/GlpR family DNA-binding transcription regulator n=1 Tax=Primorskyibacter marinus TaxID=1977320 RepID=UPI000E307C20|nr:DeoR/GlpR family DNA-binding transcription regulator [Primorskyibacter marinus]